MASSRAVWFPRARAVELRSEEVPPPGDDEVRVRALASALSPGTEMLVYRSQVSPDLPLDLPTLAGSFAFPIKYGYASVGHVIEIGPGVEHLSPGDAVFVHHPHQSEYVIPASLPVRLPAVDPILGVFLANLETAITITLDAAPRLGEHVVIFGQGVVGLLVTQLLSRTGATVIAVDPIERRRELAVMVGAERAVDPEGVAEALREVTAGRGADVAIEVSGNETALAQALESVAFAGTVVVAAWYGSKPVHVPLGGPFHRGRLRLVSSQVGSFAPALSGRWDRERRMGLALDLLPQLTVQPLISHRIPVERAASAYDLVDRHPEETVQVLLTYGGEDV